MSACPACRGIPCRCKFLQRLRPVEAPAPPKSCDSCTHWLPTYALRKDGKITGHMGRCRHHSPVAGVNPEGFTTTVWPETSDGERCGDWEAIAP